jgi:hypothetical protein
MISKAMQEALAANKTAVVDVVTDTDRKAPVPWKSTSR